MEREEQIAERLFVHISKDGQKEIDECEIHVALAVELKGGKMELVGVGDIGGHAVARNR